jgi:trimethylamine-N-oxide reductase (cytochrome c)
MPYDKSKGKTVYKALGLGGYIGGGSPCAVDVEDGRIIRVRPMHYDLEYTREYINPWQFKRLIAGVPTLPTVLNIP